MAFDYHLGRRGWFPAAGRFAESIGHVSNYPLAYVYALFLALSGHLIGRRAWIRYATPLYPNSYVCLVGPSGLAHKSTAMALGLESLGELLEDIPIINSLSTSQGLLLAMQNGGGTALVVLDELATLLHKQRQDFAADLMSKIVVLYSCPAQDGTHTRVDPITVHHTFLTIISGSTIEWLRTSLTSSDLMAGFGNRMTFILGDPRLDNPWPKQPYWEDLQWEKMLDFEGQIRLDENARLEWDAFYGEFAKYQKAATPFVRVLSERVPEKILKTAVVMAAWGNTTVVNEVMLSQAVDWGKYLIRCVEKLVPNFEDVERQVQVAIIGGADDRQKLFGALSHVFSVKRLREAIQNLQWLGLLVEEDGQFRVT